MRKLFEHEYENEKGKSRGGTVGKNEKDGRKPIPRANPTLIPRKVSDNIKIFEKNNKICEEKSEEAKKSSVQAIITNLNSQLTNQIVKLIGNMTRVNVSDRDCDLNESKANVPALQGGGQSLLQRKASLLKYSSAGKIKGAKLKIQHKRRPQFIVT